MRTSDPSDESLGYFHMSLRDTKIRFIKDGTHVKVKVDSLHTGIISLEFKSWHLTHYSRPGRWR